MPYQNTKSDQVKYLNNWFDTWSDLQKDDFLTIFAQSVNPGNHINGLTGSSQEGLEDRKKPSIFDCQVKLFQDWYGCWEENEKQEFLIHIRTTDETFCTRLDAVLNGDVVERHTEADDQALTLSPLSINEVDDGIAGHSSSSSTLSSLTQSQSNNDSGLEATTLEGEAIREEN